MSVRFAHLHFSFSTLLKQGLQRCKIKMPAIGGAFIDSAEREGFELFSTTNACIAFHDRTKPEVSI